jgi:hypothetical protein
MNETLICGAVGLMIGIAIGVWRQRRRRKEAAKKSGLSYDITLLCGRVYTLYPETGYYFVDDIELAPFPIKEPFYIVRAYDKDSIHQTLIEIRLIKIDGHEMSAVCTHSRPYNTWRVHEGKTLDQILDR